MIPLESWKTNAEERATADVDRLSPFNKQNGPTDLIFKTGEVRAQNLTTREWLPMFPPSLCIYPGKKLAWSR